MRRNALLALRERRAFCSSSSSTRTDVQEYAAALQSCVGSNSLSQGKLLHEHIINAGLEQHMFLGNCIINMYIRCISIQDARSMFEKMPERNVVTWTSLIAANVQNGHFNESLKLFRRMLLHSEASPNSYTFVGILGGIEDPTLAGYIHGLIIESGCETELLVGNALINTYSKCNCVDEAVQVFNMMPERDIVSWTSVIGAYAQGGYPNEALQTFQTVLLEGFSPNKVTFVAVIGACSTGRRFLSEGVSIHSMITEAGFSSDTLIANSLMNLYTKSGRPGDAEAMFSSGEFTRDIVSWNAVISACIEHECPHRAVYFFRQMRLEGMKPNSVTFITVLTAFGSSASVAKRVHYRVRESGYGRLLELCNAVITTYARCGAVLEAWDTFKRIRKDADLVSYNAMLGAPGFEQFKKLFHQMLHLGITPNKVTFISVLNACAENLELKLGSSIHAFVSDARRNGRDIHYTASVSLATALVNMYGKCGSLLDAQLVFNSVPLKNRILYNAMLTAVAVQRGPSVDSCKILRDMLLQGQTPDELTLTTVLSACSCAEDGELLEACIAESGYQSACLDTALIGMYSKTNRLEDARKIFESMNRIDVVSWTSMFTAFSENKSSEEVHYFFKRMLLEGIKPDNFAFASVLDCVLDLALGRLVQRCIMESSVVDVVVENALVDMYTRCASPDDAWRVFYTMKRRDVVSWNIVIAAYSEEAFPLFRRMQLEGVRPDRLTFAAVLNSRASLGVLSPELHALTREASVESDVGVATGLVKMYARCGNLEEARNIYQNTSEWRISLLNSVLGALSQHGHPREAVKLFSRMQQEGTRPDVVTLTSVLSSCVHSGLLDFGLEIFFHMQEYYTLSPTVEHYACAVDLLGRAGRVAHAEELVRAMPFAENQLVLMSLLSACKLQGDVERGKCCAQRILELDPDNSAVHVILSNILCAAGVWKGNNVTIPEGKAGDVSGVSKIQIGTEVHEFMAGDRSHTGSDEMYKELEKLDLLMKEQGIVPEQTGIQGDYHSEMLAVAYGIINTRAGTTLRVEMTTECVCERCHVALKCLSWIVGRDIVVKDAIRFHHFVEGNCSCKD